MNSANLRMAVRFLRGSYAGLSLTVVALACGVALVCALDLVGNAVVNAFVEVVDTMAGRASLQVTAGAGGLIAEDLVEGIARVPGVEFAVPVVSATAFVADTTGEMLNVHGVDITSDAAVRVYEGRGTGGLVDDPLVFLNQPDSILLTRAFAERRALGVGGVLDLETPLGRKAFVIRGLLEPHGVAQVYGGNLVVMDIAAAELHFTRAGFVNRIDVVVNREADLATVRGAVAAVLPQGLTVESPSQRKADLNSVMQSLHALLQAMGMVGIVAAFLIAFSRLSAVFEARVWQLGVLRAGGVRVRAIYGTLLTEAGLLGAAGVVVGIPLGIAIGRLLVPVIATTTALNYKLIAPEMGLRLAPSSIVLATIVGLGASLLAAALPAWRAARLAVVELIRARGCAEADRRRRILSSIRAITALGIVAFVGLQLWTRSAFWGLIATGLIAVAAALAAEPLLRVLQPLIVAATTWAVGPAGRFVNAISAEKIRRTALTVAMLGVGLGSMVWLRVVAHSFENSLSDALSQALQGDLVVTSAHIASGYVEAPVDERLCTELSSLHGIEAAVGERLTDWRHADGPIAIDAFDEAYFSGGRFGQWRLLGGAIPDVWNRIVDGSAVLVSSNFALNVGAKVGDTITIDAAIGPVRVQVGGITVNFSSPRGTIIMARGLYKRGWLDAQVNRVFLRTAPAVSLDEVRKDIAERLGRTYGLRILSSGGLLDFFREQVHRAFAPIDVLAILVLLVVLLGLADTLVASVADRTREFGMMRAVGIQRRYLRRIVVAEAAVHGGVGLLLAIVVGLGLGVLWVEQTFAYLLGWALELYVPFAGLAFVFLATAVVCYAAAIVPARRAAGLVPADALRYE